MPQNKTRQPGECKARSYVKRRGGMGERGKMSRVLCTGGGLKRNNTPETALFLYDLKQ